jgi:hypothetical protein
MIQPEKTIRVGRDFCLCLFFLFLSLSLSLFRYPSLCLS